MEYVRSSRCKADSPMCVEVSRLDTDLILVRDSKTGSVLGFSRDEWDVFLAGAKDGEFDLRPPQGSA